MESVLLAVALSRQWPTPPEQEKPREKGGKSSRLAG